MNSPWTITWTRAAQFVTIQNGSECHEYEQLTEQERADILGLLPLMVSCACWFETTVRCEL